MNQPILSLKEKLATYGGQFNIVRRDDGVICFQHINDLLGALAQLAYDLGNRDCENENAIAANQRLTTMHMEIEALEFDFSEDFPTCK